MSTTHANPAAHDSAATHGPAATMNLDLAAAASSPADSAPAGPAPRAPWLRSPRAIDALFAAAWIAAAALLYAGFIAPSLARRGEAIALASRHAELRTAVEALTSDLRRTQARAERLRAERAASPIKLQPAGELNLRLQTITQLAEHHGLAVERLGPGAASLADSSPRAARDAARVRAIPLALTGKADFPAFVRAVAELHARFRDTAVRELHFISNLSDQLPPAANATDPAAQTADTANTPAPRSAFLLELVWYAAPDGFAAADSPRTGP